MVFFGEARWKEARPEPVARRDDDEPRSRRPPHESPWLMWVPLVVLAILAHRRRAPSTCPSPARDYLHSWLEPVVEGSQRTLGAASEDAQVAPARASPRLGARARRHRAATWSTSASGSRPFEPAFLADGWYYDQTVTAFVGGPGRAGLRGDGDLRRQGHRRRGRRHGSRHPRRRAAAAPDAERLRPQLRARHRRRCRAAARLVRGEGRWPDGRLPAPHRDHRAARRSARSSSRCCPASRPELVRPVAVTFTVATLALTVSHAGQLRDRGGRLPVHVVPPVDRGVGHRVEPGVDGISLFLVVLTGAAVPAGAARRRPPPRREALHGLDAPAGGRAAGLVPVARPVPVLHLLRDRAGPDVLPDRRLGLRRAGLRRGQVLPVHHGRLGLHAGRHPGHRLPLRAARTVAGSPSTWWTSRRTGTSPPPRPAGSSPPSPSPSR